MGRKPSPRTLKFHKFKKTTNLLTRVNERVAGGVYQRPEWFDTYQRFPVDMTDIISTMTREELEYAKQQSRIRRSHPGQALLDRIFQRRPSFASDAFDGSGEPNLLQKYFNRMYDLLEKQVPENQAFAKCDVDFKGELAEFERSLTNRRMTQDQSKIGIEVAHKYLADTIAYDTAKASNMELPEDFKATGFELGEGKIHEPMPFSKKDTDEYEKAVAQWYDRSKFPWAHNHEDGLSRVTDNGMIIKELADIQSEMRFAIDNPLKSSTDGLEAREYEKYLAVRRVGNRPDQWEARPNARFICRACYNVYDPREAMEQAVGDATFGEDEKGQEVGGMPFDDLPADWKCPNTACGQDKSSYIDMSLKLDDHRELAHLCLQYENAKKHVLKELKSVAGGKELVPDGLHLAYLLKSKNLKRVLKNFKDLPAELESDCEALLSKIPEEEKSTYTAQEGPFPLNVRAKTYEYVKQRMIDAEGWDKDVESTLKRAAGVHLPERQALEDFLVKIQRPDLVRGDGTFDVAGLKELQRLPAILEPYVEFAQKQVVTLEELNKKGVSPGSGSVRSVFHNLQKVTDFVEEVMMSQLGKLYSLDDLLTCRDLYRASIVPEYIARGEERRMLNDVWDDVEQLERMLLVNEKIIPSMTMSQFNRVADSPAFLSRLVPHMENLPWGPEDDPKLDLLHEVGYGRLSEDEVKHAIKVGMIFPARVRSYILRMGKPSTLRKLRPNLGRNKALEKIFEQQEYERKRYHSHGSGDNISPIIFNQMRGMIGSERKLQSQSRKLEAQWEATALQFEKEGKRVTRVQTEKDTNLFVETTSDAGDEDSKSNDF
mmetsp:Transcript_19776/g.38199  ORF Transcript_19776/g.38199 Transcript_19776/m.38199 type:complete len:827 (-) Transcript_19776:110-2590(-)